MLVDTREKPDIPDLLPVGPDGKRRDRRFPVNQPADLVIPGITDHRWRVQIRDVSRRGMQLTTDKPVEPGPLVRIEWNGREIVGAIRHQKRRGRLFYVGIQLSTSWETLVSEVLARQSDELRESNKALAEQASVLQHQADLLNLTYDAIVVTDLQGIISFWNRGAERMYGWPVQEALGKNAQQLLCSEMPDPPEQINREILAGGRWEGEVVQTRKDGSKIVVASRWALERSAKGRPVTIMAINSDITAKQKAEQERAAYADELKAKSERLEIALLAARQTSEAKSRFLANVSHELRTPLNGIIGFCELMHDGLLGPISGEQRESLDDVLGCSNHLLALVNDLLDLTRVESGKIEFRYEPIALERSAGEVIESLKAIAAAKRIHIGLECDSAIGLAYADLARLKQVLYNYLSNALKFTAAGGRITVRIAPEGESCYRVEVIDTGVGIAAADLPRLFQEFEQLCASEKSRDGTGLGLAITKRIVESQGGHVGVESTPGQGSRFYATFLRDPRK